MSSSAPVGSGGWSGPLRWMRFPVPWELFDADEDAHLRIFYQQAGSSEGPDAAIAEVVLSEQHDVVAVTLFERALVGTRPDGTAVSTELAGVPGCLEVSLTTSLDDRVVIDGSTGRPARRRSARDSTSRLHHDTDGFDYPLEHRGCPRWIP